MRLAKSKRSLTMTTGLAAIILALIGGLVVAGVIYQISVGGKKIISAEACRDNVLISSKTATATLDLKDVIPITQCYATELGELEPDLNSQAAAIADSLQKCWYMFGEGKLVPWTADGATCFVCATFKTPSFGVDNNFLIEWMTKQTIPGKQTTYFSFLQKAIPYGKFAIIKNSPRKPLFGTWIYPGDSPEIAALSPNTQYAIVYQQIVGESIELLYNQLHLVKGTNVVETAFITPASNLGDGCLITYMRLPQT